MPRPRIGDTPQNYLLATEVLPRGLVVAALRQLTRKKHTTRVLTISTLRETAASELLGADLYLMIGNHLSHASNEKTWRVYFPRQLETVNYDVAYANAAHLLKLGYSRQVVCLAVNISDVSITRNVVMPAVRGTPPAATSDHVAVGYEHCLKHHSDKLGELSQYTLGMVGQALRSLEAA
jgi:hypothetical protein